MISGDTIAAISSATGSAPRMIVRISGPEAARIAECVWDSDFPAPASAARGTIILDQLRIAAWCYFFQSPRSYTTEDTIEFHIPGNPLIAKMLMERLYRAGARPAEPGEFTARAYFNGRLDLTEAEGVAATITAGSDQELSAARRLMSGELSRRIKPAIETVANTLALIEVGIDFSDEDVTFLPLPEVSSRISDIDRMLKQLLDESTRFERLTHEPVVVLAGRPNAGKSTLLNALAGHERAVVSPVAGTTRDVLSAEVALPRGIIRLMDIAGLEEAGTASKNLADDDQIDRKMQSHALRAMQEADHVVFVREPGDSRPEPAMLSPDLMVLTKSETIRPDSDEIRTPWMAVSAVTGQGMGKLLAELDRLCFGDSSATAVLSLNARHVQAIEDARDSLSRAQSQVENGAEFIALELRQALDALGQISGKISPDDMLGRVFSAFCIGK